MQCLGRESRAWRSPNPARTDHEKKADVQVCWARQVGSLWETATTRTRGDYRKPRTESTTKIFEDPCFSSKALILNILRLVENSQICHCIGNLSLRQLRSELLQVKSRNTNMAVAKPRTECNKAPSLYNPGSPSKARSRTDHNLKSRLGKAVIDS